MSYKVHISAVIGPLGKQRAITLFTAVSNALQAANSPLSEPHFYVTEEVELKSTDAKHTRKEFLPVLDDIAFPPMIVESVIPASPLIK